MNTRKSLVGFLILLCHGHVTGNDVEDRAADPVAQLTAQNQQLTHQVTQLNAQLTSVQSDLTHKNDLISGLRDDVRHQMALITNLTHTVNQKGSKLESLDGFCRNNVDHINNRLTDLEQDVAFSVQFNNDSVGNLAANTTHFGGSVKVLKFDRIKYQTGGENYNKSTGFFTAPVSGTYAFFLTIQRNNPYSNDCLEVTMLKNWNFWLAVASACPDGYTSTSNMAVTHLGKGETVHVQTSRSNELLAFVHTTFNGFQVN